MQQVITAEQAKKITKGRTPLVPMEYEDALKGLQACLTLDEAKYWSDKADALAAWAKIYHSDDAGRTSAQVKLHAFKRMGQIAAELKPWKGAKRGKGNGSGSGIGPGGFLRQHGLSESESAAAVRLSRLSGEKFQKFIELPRPPSPTTVLGYTRMRGSSDAWTSFTGPAGTQQIRSFCNTRDPKALADSMHPEERLRAKAIVADLIQWLDKFDLCLTR